MLEFPSYSTYRVDFDPSMPTEYILAHDHHSSYPLPSGGATIPVGNETDSVLWLADEPPEGASEPLEPSTTPEGVRYFVLRFASVERSLQLGPYHLVRCEATSGSPPADGC
jgi:hypothetical protein